MIVHPFYNNRCLRQAVHDVKRKSNSDIVLVPQPSNNPNDPLNWPAWKKTAAFIAVGTFSSLGTWVIVGATSAFVLLAKEFNEDVGTVVDGVNNYPTLLMGAGVIFPGLFR